MHGLLLALILFILLSGFFSGSETGMMSLNRYRLRHLVRKKHCGAMRSNRLLARPDRLLGIILIGNTFCNILASSLATIIAIKLYGNVGILIATIVLTLLILVFAEILPKTIAASYPEKFAFFVSWPLQILLFILYPIVWAATGFVNGLLRLLHLQVKRHVVDPLTYDELRTVVYESASKITDRHQDMLLRILDLRHITVDDVMVPRNEIIGIDINDKWTDVLKQLADITYAHVLVYRDSVDNVVGILHIHKVIELLLQDKLVKNSLLQAVDEIYFIPEATSLTAQLLNFQHRQISLALVVDEYGDIQGLVTLEDILEEIVGEFASEAENVPKEIMAEQDGGFLVDGGINLRDLNRELHWQLPIAGPKTLSGLIIEHLEAIPKAGVKIEIAGYAIEVVKVQGKMVKLARMMSRGTHE